MLDNAEGTSRDTKPPSLLLLTRKGTNNLPLVVVASIAIIVFGLSTALAIRYSGQHILESHAFRQTQTALTSFWLCRTGFKLAYETPVAGYPWSIPLEFPIYQLIVAKISCGLSWDLERVGRLVSYSFLLLCLVPVGQIFRTLYPGSWPLYLWVFSGLFLSSPEYLFWGRAFMIETTALFFTLCFLAYSIRLFTPEPQWKDVIVASFFLTLSMLQKATTPIPVLLLVASGLAGRALLNWSEPSFKILLGLKFIVALVLPVLVGYAWLHYSDLIKMQNAFGASLTSAALSQWNYGTIGARFSSDLWVGAILKRTALRAACGVGFIAAAFGVCILPRKERLLILLSFGAFLLSFLIFENLNLVHDYYQVANAVFVILAAAIAFGAFLQMSGNRSRAALLALVLAVGVNFTFFKRGYSRLEVAQMDEKNSDVMAVSSIVRKHTDQRSPILVYGDSWSSEIAFFSQRKSFTVPEGFSPHTRPIEHPISYLGQQESAVVLCGPERIALKEEVRHFVRPTSVLSTKNCDVFVR